MTKILWKRKPLLLYSGEGACASNHVLLCFYINTGTEELAELNGCRDTDSQKAVFGSDLHMDKDPFVDMWTDKRDWSSVKKQNMGKVVCHWNVQTKV